MAALSLIDTGRNIAANMYLSILFYSYTSFSISPPHVLCFSDLEFLHKKEVLLTEMLLFLSCEETVVVMVRRLVALLCCPRIGSSVNSLISSFQTAGRRESHF